MVMGKLIQQAPILNLEEPRSLKTHCRSKEILCILVEQILRVKSENHAKKRKLSHVDQCSPGHAASKEEDYTTRSTLMES